MQDQQPQIHLELEHLGVTSDCWCGMGDGEGMGEKSSSSRMEDVL